MLFSEKRVMSDHIRKYNSMLCRTKGYNLKLNVDNDEMLNNLNK